jgi:hypothetical protein
VLLASCEDIFRFTQLPKRSLNAGLLTVGTAIVFGIRIPLVIGNGTYRS